MSHTSKRPLANFSDKPTPKRSRNNDASGNRDSHTTLLSLVDLPIDILLHVFHFVLKKPSTPILPLVLTCRTFYHTWKTHMAPSSSSATQFLVTKMNHVTKASHSPEFLEWAKFTGCPWNTNTTAVIARNGNLAQLKRARELGCPWDEQTTYNAAANGHLECLMWAKENGCNWNDTKICGLAAYNGRLDILKWVRDIGGAWNEDTCSEAASGGQLEVLQWLRHNGCPWDSFTCLQAWYKGHMNILRWARENNAPFDIAFVVLPE